MSVLPRAVVRKSSPSDVVLKPGLFLAVQFSGDPGWWHERLVLQIVYPKVWVVYTPHGDLYAEETSEWEGHIFMAGCTHYPQVDGSFVSFSEPVDNEALDALMVRAMAVRAQMHAGRSDQVRSAPKVKGVDWDGAEYHIPAELHGRGRRAPASPRTPETEEKPRAKKTGVTFDIATPSSAKAETVDLSPPDGHIWCVCDAAPLMVFHRAADRAGE